MKRLIPLVLCLLLLCSCSKTDEAPKAFTYQKAPDLFQLDLTPYNPSTNDVRFCLDEEGYLISYMYKLDGRDILVTYSYEGRTITVIAFADDERVDIQIFPATSDFDPNLPMTVYKGYYIRGYKMPQES